MRRGRAILRGIKLAAFACAGLLVCMVVYDVMTLAPSAHPSSEAHHSGAVADPPAGHRPSSSTVPPPPPLSRQAKSSAPSPRPASSQRLPETRDAVRIRAVDASEGPASPSAGSNGVAAPAPTEVSTALKDGDPPAAIVIVRPPVRTPQDNRALRWIKSVGHALRIGREKDE